jgi:hypothetical protein
MSLPKEEDLINSRPDQQRQHVAHNSYLQGFADLGVFGGCLFVGAFVTAGWSLYRFGGREHLLLDHDLKSMHPYLFAGLAAYCLGMLSLSICFIIPTYLMLGLSVAYTRMAGRAALVPPTPLRFDLSLLSRFAVAGVFTLASIYVFVRFLA